MKVAKFGGSSVASAGQIKKVCSIILSDHKRKVIVVSAPGKFAKDDIKVTDLLIACANKYIECKNADKEIALVVERFDKIVKELGMSGKLSESIELDLRQRVYNSSELNEHQFVDLIKSAGEDNCAKLVARYLQHIGVKARYINPKEAGLFLTDEHSNARVLPQSFDNLEKLKELDGILVFPGFFGYSLEGEVVTFSRGGSDITGAILSAALNVEMYENFSDVDFVFSANPNIVKDPNPITVITYEEMRELSYAGFSILHEETLEPLYLKGIPVCIKNTNNPTVPGTIIKSKREPTGNPVVGIAGDKGFCSIYISKFMMNREIGFGRKVLEILENENIPYEHIPSGIDNLSIVIAEKYITPEKEKNIINRIKTELEVNEIYIEKNIALIMVVGVGMKCLVGMTAKASQALAEYNINIEMINQGSSEVSMMYGIRADDLEKAINALYKVFFIDV